MLPIINLTQSWYLSAIIRNKQPNYFLSSRQGYEDQNYFLNGIG